MHADPFFLVACGRSGTSLLRGLLNEHSRIAIPTESLFMIDYLRVRGKFDLDELIDLLVDEPEIAEWGLTVTGQELRGFQDITDILRALHTKYAASKRADVWGQKTPRIIRNLGLVGEAFPEARFIHLVRDPRAVVNSLINSDVHRSTAYHGSRRWSMDVSAGLAYEDAHPERILRVRYEDLVRDTASTLEGVLDFLDLEFEANMTESQTGLEEYSAFYDNIHKNLARGVSDEHVKKWQHQLDPQEIAVIESITGKLMDRLSYPRQASGTAISALYPLRMRARRAGSLILQTSKYLRQRREYLLYLLKRKRKLGLLQEFLWKINF